MDNKQIVSKVYSLVAEYTHGKMGSKLSGAFKKHDFEYIYTVAEGCEEWLGADIESSKHLELYYNVAPNKIIEGQAFSQILGRLDEKTFNWFRSKLADESLKCKEKAFDFDCSKKERFDAGTRKFICEEFLTSLCVKKMVKDVLFSGGNLTDQLLGLNLSENEKKHFLNICLNDKSLLRRFLAMPKRYEEYSNKLESMADCVEVKPSKELEYYSQVKNLFDNKNLDAIIKFAGDSVGLFKKKEGVLGSSWIDLVTNRGDSANKNNALMQVVDQLQFKDFEWLIGGLREKSKSDSDQLFSNDYVFVLDNFKKICYKKSVDLAINNPNLVVDLRCIVADKEEKELFIDVCKEKSENGANEKVVEIQSAVEMMDFDMLPTE